MADQVNANQVDGDLQQANGGNNQENIAPAADGVNNAVNGAQNAEGGGGNQGDGDVEVNNVPEILPYTTDEDFAEIRNKDKHV